MMLCTPYRCAQDRKNIRRQLFNWSGKTLGLVGLEEVLIAAHGPSAREKIPFNDVSGILSQAIDAMENDNNTCGICGKLKKHPYRKHESLVHTSSAVFMDLTSTAQLKNGDQPIDLSKSSKAVSSPSLGTELISAQAPSMIRTPGGNTSPNKAMSAKRQRVGASPFNLQGLEGVDPSIIAQLVNNLSKVPTASPNAHETLQFGSQLELPGPSNAPTHSNRHNHKTSAVATAGSQQRTAQATRNQTGAIFTGEPSDISSSTLSDQDAVNRFKQWRVASWVQEASRHQREGSAIAHHEEQLSDPPGDAQSSRQVSTSRNNNFSATNLVSQSSPPPLSSVLRNNSQSVVDAKAAQRKRTLPSQQPSQPVKNTSPPSASNHKTPVVDTNKRSRQTDLQQPSSSNVAAGTSSNNAAQSQQASLNNLASVLSQLFPTVTATSTTPSTTQGATNSTDLDALLSMALQNWPGASPSLANGLTGSSSAASDPTTALLTAAYQQQMQQAALLQLQYASIFSNPLLYSNILLGNGSGNLASGSSSTTASSLAALANALGGTTPTSSNANVDAVLTEALLAMLGGGSSTATAPAINSSGAVSSSNKQQQRPETSSQRQSALPSSSKQQCGTPSLPHKSMSSPSKNVPTAQLHKRVSSPAASGTEKKQVLVSSKTTPVTSGTPKMSSALVSEHPQDLSIAESKSMEQSNTNRCEDNGEALSQEHGESEEENSDRHLLSNDGKVQDDEELNRVVQMKQLCSVAAATAVNGSENGDIRMKNGKVSSDADESNASHPEFIHSNHQQDNNSRDSQSSAHLECDEQHLSTSPPVPPASRNGKATEIIDLQTTV